MNNVIITQLRNQSGRILDWILYHYEEGFDTFIIYDDYSEDSTVSEINNIMSKYNISIILKNTDGLGKKYNILDCSNSESYVFDNSLNRRIKRSYSAGNSIVKSINPDAICAIIDIDEFLVSNSDKKLTDIIRENLILKNVDQLVINSFDVYNNYKLGDWYTTSDDTSNRWDFNDTFRTHFKNRYKSVIISKSLDVCNSPHILRWENDPIVDNKNLIDSFRILDFNLLRIHHFRKPNLKININFTNDSTLINKMRIIKNKYEKL